MKNSKFLDNYKNAGMVYSIIIIIVLFSSLIIFTPNHNNSSSRDVVLPYFSLSHNISLSQEMNSFSVELDISPIYPMIRPVNLNGYSHYTLNIPLNATLESESISQSTNFIGIVIALLFTLIVLPVQYILGTYSQKLVERVINDKTFKFTLFFFMFVFIVQLFELIIFGVINGTYLSYIALIINFTLIFLALCTFYIFIRRVFYLLDIGNHLTDMKDETVGMIHLACKDQDVLTEVTNETEIIFDSIQRSIEANRFETVISGLDNILEIALKYIKECKPEKDNEFMLFIIKGLYNTKNVMYPYNNLKTIDKLISISAEIFYRLFYLKKEDFDTLSKIVDLITDIILDNDMVKRAYSTQINGIESLFKIGKLSMEQDNTSILRDVTSSLGKIGRIGELSDTEIKKLSIVEFKELFNAKFKLRLCSNKKLSNLLFLTFDKIDHLYQFNLNDIIEEINKNVIFSLSNPGTDLYSKDIFPFIDPNAKYSLANFFAIIIKNNLDDYSFAVTHLFLENFIEYIKLCMKNLNAFLKALPDVISIYYSTYKTLAITVCLISKSTNNERLISILEKQMDIFYLIVLNHYEYHSQMKFKFRDYMVLLPLSFYLISIYNEDGTFNTILKEYVQKILNLVKVLLDKYNENIESYDKMDQTNKKAFDNLEESLVEIYPYLRLTGALLYKDNKDSDFMKDIREVLKKFETEYLPEQINFYPDYYILPVFTDIKDEELINNLKKVNKLNNHDTEEFDVDFMGDFIRSE